MKEIRYSLTTTRYIWAKDDNDAKRKAIEWHRDEDRKNDNTPIIQSLVCRPWGTIESRELAGLDDWLDETVELEENDFPAGAEQ